MIPLAKSKHLGLADGQLARQSRITYAALLDVAIGDDLAQHHEQIIVFVADV